MAIIGTYHGTEKMRGIASQEYQQRNIPPRGRFDRMFAKQAGEKSVLQPHLVEEFLKQFGSLMGGTTDDNPRILAGFTFLGQFLGHDTTFDPTSSREQQDDREARWNYRTPALDLDSLYASGPAGSPHLYNREQGGKFFLDEGKEFDLPRNSQGTALIGDPRNDDNLILAQLHLAFLKFHNAVLDLVQADKIPNDGYGQGEEPFERTQRLVRWHYQWIILREYLPLIVGRSMLLDVLKHLTKHGKLENYQWGDADPFMPLEFSVAAFRFGHSQVRPLYRINDNHEVGVLPLFSSNTLGQEREDLRGGPVKKKHAVNWAHFFCAEEQGLRMPPGRYSKKIAPYLASPLLYPPRSIALHRRGESRSLARKNLAVRDIARGRAEEMLSGQKIARLMAGTNRVIVRTLQQTGFNVNALRKDWTNRPKGEQAQFESLSQQFEQETPLWYYILREADEQHEGKMLGDVGGRIVAEVLIGLLHADKTSVMKTVDLAYLCDVLGKDPTFRDDRPLRDVDDKELQISPDDFRDEERNWKPVLREQDGQYTIGDFTMVDLLRLAKVDMK